MDEKEVYEDMIKTTREPKIVALIPMNTSANAQNILLIFIL